MRHALLTILFIIAAGQLCRFGLPWWGIAPIGALAGWLFPQMPLKSLATGLVGGFFLWLLQAWWLDAGNAGILSGRVGALFMGLSATSLLLLTGIMGGLLAGFGCLTGRLARDLVAQPAKA